MYAFNYQPRGNNWYNNRGNANQVTRCYYFFYDTHADFRATLLMVCVSWSIISLILVTYVAIYITACTDYDSTSLSTPLDCHGLLTSIEVTIQLCQGVFSILQNYLSVAFYKTFIYQCSGHNRSFVHV